LAHFEGVVDTEDLVVTVVDAAVDYPFQDFLWIVTGGLCYLVDSLWCEGSFCIDEEYFSVESSFLFGELCSDTGGHTYLGFACSEFADEFGYGLSLKPSAQ